MYIVVCYAAYLAVSLAVTVWVAQTLRRNGRSFLVDAFQGNRDIADSVNHLLVVGYTRAKLFRELLHRQKVPVIWRGRVIELPQQCSQLLLIAQRQRDCQIQTPRSWKPTQKFRICRRITPGLE